MSDHALAMFDPKPEVEVQTTEKMEKASYVEDLVESGIDQLIEGAIALLEEKKNSGDIKARFFSELASRKITFL